MRKLLIHILLTSKELSFMTLKDAISYPAESQDLSLIEIVWDAIGRSINTPKPLPHTTQKLCENVGAASQNSIRNLYNSRLRRRFGSDLLEFGLVLTSFGYCLDFN
uniref:Uncharacterized protein n=1 Tax=Astyanax mexicanus TaxID=7994 RepID=A0A8B9LDM8_ASTMX